MTLCVRDAVLTIGPPGKSYRGMFSRRGWFSPECFRGPQVALCSCQLFLHGPRQNTTSQSNSEHASCTRPSSPLSLFCIETPEKFSPSLFCPGLFAELIQEVHEVPGPRKLTSDLAGTRSSGCAQILDFSGKGCLCGTMTAGGSKAL